jgi:signal transduction histidine kinase
VENTGRPIRPEDVRRLGEPFERLHRDADGTGAGLGLSIVRAVADAHGARLALRTRAGGGLVAEVEFPSDPLARGRRRSRAVAPGRAGRAGRDADGIDRLLLGRDR